MMNSTGIRSQPIVFLIVISVIDCSLGFQQKPHWQNKVILAAMEASLLQIQANVVTIAETMLNGSAFEDGPGEVTLNPDSAPTLAGTEQGTS